MKQWIYTHARPLSLVAVIIFLSVSTWWYQTATLDVSLSKDFTQEMQMIVDRCADERYRPACYDREIPKLMDDGYSMEDAFMVTKEIQRADAEYQYCHVLGHYLSQKETAKDPSLWKDVVARAPRGICSNGAIHGAFQERFRAESLPDASIADLKVELAGICDARPGWKPTGLENGSCLHALGHLTMYATDGDIDKSLALCDELIPPVHQNKSSTQLCYDGAFMQIFQPLEPEDEALVDHIDVDTIEKVTTFCAKYTAEQFGSCTSESWAMYDNVIYSPQVVDTICDSLLGMEKQYDRCLNSIFYVAAAMMNLEIERIVPFCNEIAAEIRARCFGHAATRMIEVDWDNIPKAVAICDRAQNVATVAACFEEILYMSDYSIDTQTEAFTTLCSLLPHLYGARCFAKM